MSETTVAVIISCIGSAGLWSVINLLINRHYKKTDDNDVIKRALKGLLYTDCIAWGEKYTAQGFIDTQDFNEYLRYHYEPYKALGGDGTIDRLMGELQKLPSHK